MSISRLIEEAVGAVAAGEVVGVPTDTVYGLAADPFRAAALERLFEVKGRPPVKPVALLVASHADAARIGDLAGSEGFVLDQWPGPLTLVVRRRTEVPAWVGDEARGTVGVRCPDHPLALELLRRTGPLAVTSANVSGAPPVTSAEEAEDLFGEDVAVYLPGESPGGAASTVIDLTVTPAEVLREGPVRWLPPRTSTP